MLKCQIKTEAKIDSDNGLAPDRRQTIIWTNDDLAYWRIMCHSTSMSLIVMAIISQQ